MIAVSETMGYFRNLLLRDEFRDIVGMKCVIDDSHASNKLRSASGAQLIVVMPTVMEWGDANNNRQQSTMMLFVVEKMTGPAITDDAEERSYNRLQDILHRVIQQLKDDAGSGNRLWYNIGDADVEISPEYNLFGGWNGWSATLVF